VMPTSYGEGVILVGTRARGNPGAVRSRAGGTPPASRSDASLFRLRRSASTASTRRHGQDARRPGRAAFHRFLSLIFIFRSRESRSSAIRLSHS
jgi:hypothetical protein